MHRIHVCLALTVAMLAAAPSPAAPPPDGKKYALLIGVKAYQDDALPNGEVRYAENDVAALAQVLKNAGYEVVQLTTEAGAKDKNLLPSLANIRRELARLTNTDKKGSDTVLVAFAGHGWRRDQAYFCPCDARTENPQTMLPLAEVMKTLGDGPARVSLVLADASRNDPGKARGLDGQDSVAPPEGVAVLFACAPGQRGYDLEDRKRGAFFTAVTDALTGEANAADADGVVDYVSLSRCVRLATPDYARKAAGDKAEQQPTEKRNLRGPAPVATGVKNRSPEVGVGNPTTPEEDAEDARDALKKLKGSVTEDVGLRGDKGWKIDLHGCKITDADLSHLEPIKNLLRLNLSDTAVTATGLKHLAGCTQLIDLNLTDTKVTDAGLKELAGLKNLRLLDLRNTQVTDAGLKELAGLDRLQVLNLADTAVTDAGMPNLVGLPLQMLDVAGTDVTDRGLLKLAPLNTLLALGVSQTKVSPDGVQRLKQSFSLARIIRH